MYTRQCLRSCLFGVALAAMAGCGGATETGILVNVGSVPAAATTVTMKVLLDGKEPTMISQQELQAAGLSRFGLALPSSLSGSLSIELTAFDSDRCIQGTAQTSLSLPSERGREIVADFVLRVPRTCENPPKPPTCAKNTLCTYAFSPVNKTLLGVYAIAPNDIWAVGSVGTVIHWDGTAWRTVSLGALNTTRDLFDVWASGPNDVWIVGASTATEFGLALRYNGTSWSKPFVMANHDLNGIHGLSANEIYAVGDNDPILGGAGEFWKWNGSQWSKMSNGVSGQLWRVFAVSSTEIWAMGFQSTLIRHNGTSATSVSSSTIGAGPSTELRHMWGTGSNNLFLVGSGGFAARYNGTSWSRVTHTAGTSTLYAVQGTSATGTVYALGNNGWLLTSDPPYTTFVPTATPPMVSTDLRELAIAQDGSAWVVGFGGYLGQLGTQ